MEHDDTGQAPDTARDYTQLARRDLAALASAGSPDALDEWLARGYTETPETVIVGTAAERTAAIDVAQQAFREAIRPAQLAYQEAIIPHQATFDAAVQAAQEVYQARIEALLGGMDVPADTAPGVVAALMQTRKPAQQ